MKLTALMLAAALLPQAAAAQYIGGRPPEPPPAPLAGTVESPEAALARNVRLIAINPRNYEALLGAGRAALRLGDPQAAIGFFGRAEEIHANHWAAKAGQGSALANMGEAQAALGLFEQARALGATQSLVALDRGLAFDLLGRQADAQNDYRTVMALAGIDEAEARRRLALSLAISGRKAEALAALNPLLARRDGGARRAQAFILALGGDVEGARQAIALMMPGTSGGFDPFLRRLPTLGPGQKAAAVHLGIMPAEGAALAALDEPPQVAPAEPPVRVAAARPAPAPPPAAARPPASAPVSSPAPLTVPAPAPVTALRAQAPAAAPKAQEPNSAGDRLASIESALVKLPAPPPAPKPIIERAVVRRAAEPERTLAARPASDEGDRRGGKAAPKATDAKPVKLAANDPKAQAKDAKAPAKDAKAPAKAAAEEAKPARAAAAAAPASGSRIYVQLAGGANADRMSREFDRIRKVKPTLFRAQQPSVSVVKGWSRLLVGPFKDGDAAQGFVNELHAAKLEGFVWNAPTGLKLEKLATK